MGPAPNSDFLSRYSRTISTGLVVLGCLGLAAHLWTSLWVFQSRVGPSLRIEHPSALIPGSRSPLRVALRDADLRPVAMDGAVKVFFSPGSGEKERDRVYLGTLEPFQMRDRAVASRAEGEVSIPPDLALGAGFLEFEVPEKDGGHWRRRCEIEVSSSIKARKPSVIRESAILRQADQSQDQPPGYRIEVRPVGDLRAPFRNQIWVRISDDKGEPVKGHIAVHLYHGQWKSGPNHIKAQEAGLLLSSPLPKTGLAFFSGDLASETVGFELRYFAGEKARRAKKATASRKVMLRAVPGGDQLVSPRPLVGADEDIELIYRSLAPGRKASFDIHDADGRWLGRCGDPRPRGEQKWRCPAPKELGAAVAGLYHIEAHAGVRRVQPGVPFARLWVDGVDGLDGVDEMDERDGEDANNSPKSGNKARRDPAKTRARPLPPAALKWMRSFIKEWPVEEQKPLENYLRSIEAQRWEPPQWRQLTSWLISATPPALFAAPSVHDTFKSAGEELKAHKSRWALRLRIWLWGGGALYVLLVALWVYYSQRRYFEQVAQTLAIEGGEDEQNSHEAAKNLSRPSRAAVLRATGIVVILAGCLVLLALFMESLVAV